MGLMDAHNINVNKCEGEGQRHDYDVTLHPYVNFEILYTIP